MSWDTPLAPSWRHETGSATLVPGLWCQLSPDRDALGLVVSASGPERVVGRAPPEGAPVQDRWMSRAQFSVAPLNTRGELRWRLTGLSARTPTHVNGVVVSRPVDLRLGDVVRAGASVFVAGIGHGGGDRDDAGLYGPSAELEGVREQVRRFAAASPAANPNDAPGIPVHVFGETGVGKQLVAEALHRASGRAGPLVVQRSAGLVSAPTERSGPLGHAGLLGLLGAAGGGTLLLDEVSELALEQQALLVAVLESAARTTGPSHGVRLLSTAHDDVQRLVGAGQFRPDLWHRLVAARIELPPLRARRLDVVPLALRALNRLQPGRMAALNAHPDGPFWLATCLEPLALHHWPGNVRELENACAVLAASALVTLTAHDALPDPTRVAASVVPTSATTSAAPARDRLPPVAALRETLAATYRGNMKAYAEALAAELGLPATSVRRRLYDLLRVPGDRDPDV